MKHKPLSELINDPNLESEDIVQYALHSKTNDNILTTNLCDLIVKYVDQQTQSLTEEIKELKAENEDLQSLIYRISIIQCVDSKDYEQTVSKLVSETLKKYPNIEETLGHKYGWDDDMLI